MSLVQSVNEPTGQAYIYGYPNGDNSIMLVGGANQGYSKVPDSWVEAVKSADVVLMQREVPEWVNIFLGKHASHLVLDCGGSLLPISGELLNLCQIVSPNETERECLIGKQPKEKQHQMMKEFLIRHPNVCLLSKEGSEGATIMSSHYDRHEDAFKAKEAGELKIMDTTGAGDTFTAAYSITSDLRFAQAAAFLCITKMGAAQSIPTLSEVNQF